MNNIKFNTNIRTNKIQQTQVLHTPSFCSLSSLEQDSFSLDNKNTTIKNKSRIEIMKDFARISNYFVKEELISVFDLLKYKNELSALAQRDLDKIIKKYEYLKDKPNIIHQSGDNIKEVFGLLADDRITKSCVDTFVEILKLRQQKNSKEQKLNFIPFLTDIYSSLIIPYEKFDTLPLKKRVGYLDILKDFSEYDKSYRAGYALKIDEVELLLKNGDFCKFPIFRDYKNKGYEKIEENLRNKIFGVENKPIQTDHEIIANFLSEQSVIATNNLEQALNSTNLKKYEKGFPLKYPRQNFVRDFEKLLKNLDKNTKETIYKAFNFNIDENKDMTGYPNPNATMETIPPTIIPILEKGKKLIEDFTINNYVKLDPTDKQLEKTINQIIKVFPEYTSIIGKIQQRGDGIDFHTFDVLKKSINNHELKKLSPKEQQILILSVLFHDFGKSEKRVDTNHEIKSSNYTREIIKKLPISVESRERIYGLIKNSHWTTSDVSDEDLAIAFRRTNDFKMAQILAKADTESAGFRFPVTQSRIDNIQYTIDKINSNGQLLCLNYIPTDKSKFDLTDDGIMYLDFSDEDALIEKYGFPKLTRVKDLRLLAHSTDSDIENLISICNDSMDVCLSALIEDWAHSFTSTYADGINVILNSQNSNIAIVCKNRGTGFKRGYDYFKNIILGKNIGNWFDKQTINEIKTNIPAHICSVLKLTKNEYRDLFEQISRIEDINTIESIKLKSGKVLRKDIILEAIHQVQEEFKQEEVVIFNPKIDAITVNKNRFFNKKDDPYILEVKKISKKYNIPLVLT